MVADMKGQQDGVTQIMRTLLVGIATGLGFGLVMALVSNGFVIGVRWLSRLRADFDFPAIELGGMAISPAPLLGLLLAALIILGVRRIFGISRWHGPADSIFAAHRTDNELDVKAGFGSTVAAFVSASGGASVGQYGPLVHFGATMGSLIRRITGSHITTDIFIGCGVAGAIAAGFNAPIAGVVFAHEAILRHFSLRAIAPIAVSSITAAWISQWIFGNDPLFVIGGLRPDLIELLPAALIAGPFFGLLAVLFMQALRTSARFAGGSGWSPARLVFTAAIVTGVVGVFVARRILRDISADTVVPETFDDSGLYWLWHVWRSVLASDVCWCHSGRSCRPSVCPVGFCGYRTRPSHLRYGCGGSRGHWRAGSGGLDYP